MPDLTKPLAELAQSTAEELRHCVDNFGDDGWGFNVAMAQDCLLRAFAAACARYKKDIHEAQVDYVNVKAELAALQMNMAQHTELNASLQMQLAALTAERDRFATDAITERHKANAFREINSDLQRQLRDAKANAKEELKREMVERWDKPGTPFDAYVQEKIDRAVLAESEWWHDEVFTNHGAGSEKCIQSKDIECRRLAANRAKVNP